MANPEHEAILKRSLSVNNQEIWNNWRKQNPNIKPDLREISLKDCNLIGIDFSNTNLSWSYLNNVDLTNCNLNGANCLGAMIANCRIIGALVQGTNFNKANLFCYSEIARTQGNKSRLRTVNQKLNLISNFSWLL
ncbi:MAG: pentapeptide repeat-containing protein [Prochloraceae cyanobacterium]